MSYNFILKLQTVIVIIDAFVTGFLEALLLFKYKKRYNLHGKRIVGQIISFTPQIWPGDIFAQRVKSSVEIPSDFMFQVE